MLELKEKLFKIFLPPLNQWTACSANLPARQVAICRSSLAKAGSASLAGIALIASAVAPMPVRAQAEYYVTPSITAVRAYDDNLLFEADDQDADSFTRISPAVEAGYQSDTLKWSGAYRFDAEAYDSYSALNSNTARRFADATIAYQASAKLLLSADASYTLTNTPADISLGGSAVLPGLLLGRARAERTSIHPSMAYRFTPSTTGLAAYTLTNDRLAGSVESDTQIAEAEFETELSEVNTVSYGYLYRRFEFGLAPNAVDSLSTAQDTHIPWAGFEHEFSERTSATGRIGPRLYDDSVEPFIQAALRHRHTNGEVLLDYQRDETTLLGQAGRVESETLSLTLLQRFGANFEAQLLPGYSELSQGGFSAEVYRVELAARYEVNDMLSIIASHDINEQRADFASGLSGDISRNLTTLGFVLSYPKRVSTQSR